MLSIPKKLTTNFSAIMCVLGHDYIITKTITPYIKEYKCCNCGREVSDDVNGELQILTEKSRQVNQCVGDFFRKKSNYLKLQL